MAMLKSRGSRAALAASESYRGKHKSPQAGATQGAGASAGGGAGGAGTTVPIVSGKQETIIRLNIGGIKFATTLGTICKFPDSMLAAMFGGSFGPPLVDEEGYFFIDRDGSHFRFILNFLRDGTVVLPDDPRQLKGQENNCSAIGV